MAEPTNSLKGQRYIGDVENKIVHDVLHEDPTPDGCRIWDLVQAGKAVRFQPDRLSQAVQEGYQPCNKCLFAYTMRRTALTRHFLDGGDEVAR
ncbi:hypothetical protein HRbin25_00346 [bacterium HR25]|jgi:phosphoribosylaminoimidazole-succinocarboxamide synthase|nr:hypothetical protein HRbin25_00346 [bacterium HR25]